MPDEPPVLFRWRQAVHRVARVRGPERLAPEWWRQPDADPDVLTRDYFAVEDIDGGRFWLFREGLYLAGAPPCRAGTSTACSREAASAC